MAKKHAHRPDGHPTTAPRVAKPATPPAPAAPGKAGKHAKPGKPASGKRAAQSARAASSGRDLRGQFEDLSAPLLLRMAELPAFLLPVVLATMLFFGLVITSAWAGILLLMIGLFLSWLTAVSWPGIGAGSRVLRLAVDVGMIALGILKLAGRF